MADNVPLYGLFLRLNSRSMESHLRLDKTVENSIHLEAAKFV